MNEETGPAPIDPGVALGETRWRFAVGPLPFRAWAAMQTRLVRSTPRAGSARRNAILWLIIFGMFLAMFTQQDMGGLDAELVFVVGGGWMTQFGGWGVAGLGAGLFLAGMAALAILAGILQGGQMRRLYEGISTLRRPTILAIGDDGAAQGDDAVVFAGRWDMITEEFSEDGVWFLRLAVGGALYVEETTLGDRSATVKAFVRERIARPG